MPMDFEMPNVRQFRPRVPGQVVLRVLLVLAAVMILFTTWFTIEPEEAGLVLRFGRFALILGLAAAILAAAHALNARTGE